MENRYFDGDTVGYIYAMEAYDELACNVYHRSHAYEGRHHDVISSARLLDDRASRELSQLIIIMTNILIPI